MNIYTEDVVEVNSVKSYISTEYYEGQTPVSTSPETTTFPESTPDFTAIGTLLSLAMILAVFRAKNFPNARNP
ncbi:hypothetical protein [Methanosarcina sp. 2.H.A.1B.4]|uniref:hypothetical protein n=1 Tax=Methanosarcina sp. 2.H.A.1B.4 TaxID=1483600 RepID=UPI000621986D|nr:hypothetical protein [Methanosarcina sp. 2.H.A.1B.4]KKG09990.1 hypothetical protein EO92_01665 [Methanosarcina sp. 2.H.A.1B.4]